MVTYADAHPLARLHDGRDHTKDAPIPILLDEDMPRTSHDALWTSETRDRLGVRPTVRIDVPVTNKNDMVKYADLLHGLATRMEYIAKNPNESEFGAYISFTHLVREIRLKLDLASGKKRKATR